MEDRKHHKGNINTMETANVGINAIETANIGGQGPIIDLFSTNIPHKKHKLDSINIRKVKG